jgi:hypothetical protein
MHDSLYRLHLQLQAFGPRRPLGFERFAELRQHDLFEVSEIVANDCFAGRYRNLGAARHRQYAAPYRAESRPILRATPTHDRGRQRGQKRGMSVQDAKAAGLVLGTHRRDILLVDDDRRRRGDQ